MEENICLGEISLKITDTFSSENSIESRIEFIFDEDNYYFSILFIVFLYSQKFVYMYKCLCMFTCMCLKYLIKRS